MTKNYEYNRAWRLRHPAKRLADTYRYYAQTQDAPNQYQPWTQAEERLVLAHDRPDRELSALIGRSVRAIHVRRVMLRKRHAEAAS